MSTELSPIHPTMNALSPQVQEMRQKLDLIKQTVAKGATDLELDLFMHACKRTGLDPLMKQIYAIKRWSAADKREVMSFQTGIDGYRLIADRTGLYAGSDEPTFTLAEDGWPEVASVTVHKLVNGVARQFSASVRWKEYCQTTKEGQMTSMWKKMPFLMLGKCAEALALRKAFPAELSGVYTHEEMMQADEEIVPAKSHKQTAQEKINELRLEHAAPAAVTVPEKGPERSSGDYPAGQSITQDTSAPVIIWNAGTPPPKGHRGKDIRDVPEEYLTWYLKNGPQQEFIDRASEEIERRHAAQLFHEDAE